MASIKSVEIGQSGGGSRLSGRHQSGALRKWKLGTSWSPPAEQLSDRALVHHLPPSLSVCENGPLGCSETFKLRGTDYISALTSICTRGPRQSSTPKIAFDKRYERFLSIGRSMRTVCSRPLHSICDPGSPLSTFRLSPTLNDHPNPRIPIFSLGYTSQA